MINPYFCYVVAFVMALLTYLVGWSDLYPPLSFSVLAFLFFTILVFSLLGVATFRSKIIAFKKVEVERQTTPILVSLFIYGLWSVEFIHAGGVPLMKILLKQPYDYRTFGVPSLHVFVVTFSSFYTIYLFHLYLSRKSVLLFMLYLLNLLSAILIYNRGMLMFNISASALLYFICRNKINWKQLTIGAASTIILLFLFGILGSLRVSRESGKPYSNDDFLETGQASESFRKSIIPKEFFWTYIYVSSPLANLQHNVNTYPVPPVSMKSFGELFNNELLMDFISKRVNSFFHLQPANDNRIPGPFNVSTVYSRSFSYLGWLGMFVTTLVLVAFPWLYHKFLPAHSPFFLTGLAILCTIYLFLAFDNTLRFTGLSFQLVYPLLLHYGSRRLPGLKNFSSTTR